MEDVFTVKFEKPGPPKEKKKKSFIGKKKEKAQTENVLYTSEENKEDNGGIQE